MMFRDLPSFPVESCALAAFASSFVFGTLAEHFPRSFHKSLKLLLLLSKKCINPWFHPTG
jgi:hypothetical protein